MSRTRHVYPTDRIAHLWFHKTQESARNQCGNHYFEGDTIYSYGGHFPIARRIVVRGETVVLFTSRGYSVTTSKHISLVQRAIPQGTKIFYCHNPGYLSLDTILREKSERVQRLTTQFKAAKNKVQRIVAWRELRSAILDAREFARFFRLKGQFPFPRDWKELDRQTAERQEAINNRAAAQSRRIRERNHQEFEARRIELEKTQEENIANWRNGGYVTHWSLRTLPTMLRINGDNVETSHGVEFPISHARRILAIVKRILDRGETWQSNGQTMHLGHYTIDRIDALGTVYAGCHVVSKEEVLRLIGELETLPAKQYRNRQCLRCDHQWQSPVELSIHSPAISGEKSEQCPKCNSREIMSSPVTEEVAV